MPTASPPWIVVNVESGQAFSGFLLPVVLHFWLRANTVAIFRHFTNGLQVQIPGKAAVTQDCTATSLRTQSKCKHLGNFAVTTGVCYVNYKTIKWLTVFVRSVVMLWGEKKATHLCGLSAECMDNVFTRSGGGMWLCRLQLGGCWFKSHGWQSDVTTSPWARPLTPIVPGTGWSCFLNWMLLCIKTSTK